VPPEDGDRIQSPKRCGFFRKNKTMDNVQLQKSFISKPSSLTFKTNLLFAFSLFMNYISNTKNISVKILKYNNNNRKHMQHIL
jgi:hypothetical protein